MHSRCFVALVLVLVLPLLAAEPAHAARGSGDAPVAYVGGSPGSTQVRLTTVAGGQARTVGPLGDVEEVAVSPDGQRVAWTDRGDSGDPNELFVGAVDGTGVRRVTTAASSTILGIAWSPDGNRIAYAPNGAIRVVGTDGSGDRELVNLGTGGADDLTWSPDGARLAFTRFYADPISTSTDVEVVNADGTGLRRVSSPAAARPSWSPDGRSLIFLDAPGFWVLDVATGASRNIRRSTPGAGESDWSPDGTKAVLLDGSLNLSDVFSPSSSSGCVIAEQQPPFFTFTEPRFMPDGRTVVFKGITQTSTTASTAALYSVPAACAGTSPTPTKISADDVYAGFDLGPNVTVRRAGATRIETAVATSQAAFASAPTVVVARSDSFADGLAGAPLAGKVGGPLLLTPRDGLPGTVGAEVTRLGATRAIILGDEGVVGPAVAASLRDRGLTVERLAGADRFATAAAVAERVGGKETYLVSGFDPDPTRGWPDALSVSGLAALDHHPVLLVTQDKLPPASANALTAMGVTKVTIIGGTAAVSDAVAAAVRATGASVDRVAGADRYSTSRAVADKAIAGGASVARSWVATGANWPDALAGGPAAAKGSGPFLLVPPTEDAGSTEWFASLRAAGSRIEMLGGPDVLPPAVRQALERAVTG